MKSNNKPVGVDELSHIDWDMLRLFYYVAQSKSYADAASKLEHEYDQSSLNRIMKSFEKSLGYPVFLPGKSKDGYSLTEQGRVLLKASQVIMEDLKEASGQIDQQHNLPEGLLKVSLLVGLLPYMLAHIPKFLKSYPGMSLSFYETDIAPDIEQLETDVLIHPFSKDRPDLIQDHLLTFNFKIYASSDYLMKHGTPTTLDDLKDHQLLSSSLSRFSRDVITHSNWILSAGMQAGQNRPSFMENNSMQSRLELAKRGLGIVCLPQEMLEVKQSNLIPILTDVQGPVVEVYYTYSEVSRQSKRIEVFGDFLKSIFGTQNNTSQKQ